MAGPRRIGPHEQIAAIAVQEQRNEVVDGHHHGEARPTGRSKVRDVEQGRTRTPGRADKASLLIGQLLQTVLHRSARGNCPHTRRAVEKRLPPGSDQQKLDIRRLACQMRHQATHILAATGGRLVPEQGIDGDPHGSPIPSPRTCAC